jgi:hypothetical protein
MVKRKNIQSKKINLICPLMKKECKGHKCVAWELRTGHLLGYCTYFKQTLF